jgi:hypothetical protein
LIHKNDDANSDVDETELVKLAYKAVTLNSPTDEMFINPFCCRDSTNVRNPSYYATISYQG